jgi:hypothetical protein
VDKVEVEEAERSGTFLNDEDFVYDKVGALAQNIKAVAQMVVGAALFGLLLIHALEFLHSHLNLLYSLQKIGILRLVSYGLMYAAGIELCFMLYTKGPDEAVAPVILSIAGAILLILSDDSFDWKDGLIVPLLVGSMAILFYLSETFIEPRDAKEKARRVRKRGRRGNDPRL